MWDSWPEPDEAIAIFRRLFDSDPVAPAVFAEAFLDPLLNFLRGTRPAADHHARLTAAEGAILSVIRNPAVYDPARGDLGAFLRMAARADLANALEAERQHQVRRTQ